MPRPLAFWLLLRLLRSGRLPARPPCTAGQKLIHRAPRPLLESPLAPLATHVCMMRLYGLLCCNLVYFNVWASVWAWRHRPYTSAGDCR